MLSIRFPQNLTISISLVYIYIYIPPTAAVKISYPDSLGCVRFRQLTPTFSRNSISLLVIIMYTGYVLRIARPVVVGSMGKTEYFICGSKMPTRCNRGFYCRSYCSLNMFRAPLCPSSGAQEYYTAVAACGISCCGFQVAGLVWS